MQTILGANGQIAIELAKELRRNYTEELRLVSRKPKRVNPDDKLFPANLLDANLAMKAVEGSEIAYFTLGLPMNSLLWEEQFPKIVNNVIAACKMHHTKLVFFDNTYMYPQDGRVLTEETPFKPVGRKGKVRQHLAELILHEMQTGELKAVICRAPEFYGPGETQSITNGFIFDALKNGKRVKVPVSDSKLRSLIWTPDASRATALIGNTPDAYNRTWHLPVDDQRLTYKQFINLIWQQTGTDISYSVVPKLLFQFAGLFNNQAKELQELLPRYASDNIFEVSKFKQAFPDFQITSYEDGIQQILAENKSKH